MKEEGKKKYVKYNSLLVFRNTGIVTFYPVISNSCQEAFLPKDCYCDK